MNGEMCISAVERDCEGEEGATSASHNDRSCGKGLLDVSTITHTH